MVDPSCQDLATKAELEIITEKLNYILGELPGGEYFPLFDADVAPTAALAAYEDTLSYQARVKADSGITDIVLEGESELPLTAGLLLGTIGFKGITAGGDNVPVSSLGKIGKVLAKNTETTKIIGESAKASAAAVSVLMSLVSIAGTLALNKATVDILDNRIEAEVRGFNLAITAQQNTMLRLFNSQEGRIEDILQQLAENEQKYIEQGGDLTAAIISIQEANQTITEQNNELDNAQQIINDLVLTAQDLKTQITTERIESQQAIDELIGTVNIIESEVGQAIELINQQREQIATQQNQITDLQTKYDKLVEDVLKIEADSVSLRDQFEKLKEDLEADIAEVEEQVEDLEGQIILNQKLIKQSRSSGGGGLVGTRAAADAQTKILDLAAKVTGKTNDTTITDIDIYNNTSSFSDIFTDLLTDFNPGTMDEQQLEDFRSNLGTDMDRIITTLLVGLVTPALTDIQDRTSQSNISSGVQKGICESLNAPNPCSVPGVNNPTQGLKGMADALKGKGDAILAALGLADIAQGQSIMKVVKSTNDIVSNTTTGVQATKEFLDKAWEATGADKVLNAITTAVVIHNGFQLSTNLASTITETANVVLEAMDVSDAQGNPFDVGEVLRSKMTSLIAKLGLTEEYAALSLKLAKYNRIYQSTANVLDATRDLFDSAHSVAELTAGNTGKIGNALLESGVVAGDAYEEMVDKVNPQTKALARIEGFRDSLDSIEETVSTVSNIASEVVSTRDSYKELIDARDEWKQENQALVDEKKQATQETKLSSEVTADVDEASFDAGTSDS